MSVRLDKVLVVDVESTCWSRKPPDNEKREIIEIGFCEIDLKKELLENKASMLVKPENSRVSRFCTELTSLRQEDVERGFSLREACGMLPAQNKVWASYGNYDREKFTEECKCKGIKYPFGPSHINVKTLFALAYKLPREIGLREALNLAKLSFEGTLHRAGDDAWNIARILLSLIRKLHV